MAIGQRTRTRKEFREQSAQATGVAKPLRGTVTANQDRSGYYLSIVEFESAEAVMQDSSRRETKFFGRLSGLMDGSVTGIGHRPCAVVCRWQDVRLLV